MAVVKINLSCELTEAVKVQYIRGNLFSQDNQANVINVAVFEGGEPAELAGTVTANVIRPDGGTVAVTGGTFEGNVATITMPSAVYAIPGMISVAVKITLDSVVTTIAAFAATVYATSTDTAVDPGTIIPSIQTLIAEIEAAVDSIPADYSSLWATLAPNYSNLTFPVAVGQYCTYDGGFYRCNTAIATQEAWTAAHWTATNIGADLAETRLDVANLEDDVSELKSAKADKDGTHEDLTAGNALFLLSDRGDTDAAPYVFRKTGGAKNGYGREFLRKIVGGTVAWNQILKAFGSDWNTHRCTAIVDGNNVEVTSTEGFGNYYTTALNEISGHVYLISFEYKASVIRDYVVRFGNMTYTATPSDTTSYHKKILLVKAEETISGATFTLPYSGSSQSGDIINARNANIFDFTQMFGSTIADAIYAMEQATAGSGVAWFRSLFQNSYYAYDAGSLQSVQAKEHKTVGFNQWDEQWEIGGINTADGTDDNTMTTRIRSKNYIPVLPNTMYYKSSPNNVRHVYYDINKNFISAGGWGIEQFLTPSNCHYLRFMVDPAYGTTYKNDICINISDPAKNGTYEPYEEHTYPLDPDLILRGIPKWDSTNGLYYDGDEYTPDGSVKRKYGIVDMGTLDWSLNNQSISRYSAIVSGIKYVDVWSEIGICENYPIILSSPETNGMAGIGWGKIFICDDRYSDAATFKTAMSGVYLVYELATPTTEQAEVYRELQISAHGGTEEFIDAGVTATTPTRDVSIPVGTETFYPVDIWHLIDELTALVLEN